jgi:hypothetical protein
MCCQDTRDDDAMELAAAELEKRGTAATAAE